MASPPPEASVAFDNPRLSRFELPLEGGTALAYYQIADGVITFTSTQTPPSLRGKGAATKLIRDALSQARARSLEIRATCSFVVAFLERHPEFSDVPG